MIKNNVTLSRKRRVSWLSIDKSMMDNNYSFGLLVQEILRSTVSSMTMSIPVRIQMRDRHSQRIGSIIGTGDFV